MPLIQIKKKQFLIFYGLFFCYSILVIFKLLPGAICFIVLILIMIWQVEFINIFSKNKKWKINNFIAWIFLLTYYTVSLSFIYYVFGLTVISLIIWLIINLLLPFFLLKNNYEIKIKLPGMFFQDLINILDRPSQIAILVILVYLISNFFAWPTLDGSSSPWTDTTVIIFTLFLLATILIIRDVIKKQTNTITLFLYGFLTVGIIAIKYVLSYGYDSLLHQGALQYIFKNGQIDPLTPFYIGQYVLEILIHYFSGWSFVFIERWFMPVIFLVLMIALARYFFWALRITLGLALVPMVILFLLPSQFIFTSPYAYALFWALVAVMGIYFYLKRGQKSDYVLAALATIISLLIHPFVGLSVLVALIASQYYQKLKNNAGRIFVLLITFLFSSVIVSLAFAFYNWLRDDLIVLTHPFYYIYNFLALFGPPIWYHYESPPQWLNIIYFYEKIHYFVLLTMVVLAVILIKKQRWINFFILVVSLGALASSWLFIASFEVSGYAYGDQINYSYRLLQVSKWFLLPIILIIFVAIFEFIRQRRKLWQTIIIIGLALVLTTSWYLTYPRFDEISRMNINNIREIDYQAIDFIYTRESGKDGYIVLANQIFGAAAVRKYGFKPYYKTRWGEIFYYSIPMSGELNQKYAEIMASSHFDAKIIQEIMAETKQRKIYLVITDYWPMYDQAAKEAASMATEIWDINQKIFIYLFEK